MRESTLVSALKERDLALSEKALTVSYDAIAEEVRAFVEQCVFAGRELGQPRFRRILRGLVQYWATFSYRHTGRYELPDLPHPEGEQSAWRQVAATSMPPFARPPARRKEEPYVVVVPPKSSQTSLREIQALNLDREIVILHGSTRNVTPQDTSQGRIHDAIIVMPVDRRSIDDDIVVSSDRRRTSSKSSDSRSAKAGTVYARHTKKVATKIGPSGKSDRRR